MGTKLKEWKVNDYLKTPEDRSMFIQASIEEAVAENDPGIFSDALISIAKSMGGKSRKFVAVMKTISDGINAARPVTGRVPRVKAQREVAFT